MSTFVIYHCTQVFAINLFDWVSCEIKCNQFLRSVFLFSTPISSFELTNERFVLVIKLKKRKNYSIKNSYNLQKLFFFSNATYNQLFSGYCIIMRFLLIFSILICHGTKRTSTESACSRDSNEPCSSKPDEHETEDPAHKYSKGYIFVIFIIKDDDDNCP